MSKLFPVSHKMYNVCGRYNGQPEVVCSSTDYKEAKADLKSYRENEAGTAFWIKTTRERSTPTDWIKAGSVRFTGSDTVCADMEYGHYTILVSGKHVSMSQMLKTKFKILVSFNFGDDLDIAGKKINPALIECAKYLQTILFNRINNK